MSRTIDERIVSMQFDNQNFEKNANQTLGTIDKLKQNLNFDGSEQGFSMLGNAAETVKVKFSALEVVAITALTNITNKAVDAGERLIKSLSIDNISAGWEKFGNKTVSVGTLISQGYDIDTVNEQLDRLNWFTDETSYNFTDMVANIAKFTASGKGLEESVTALEGIANWAALSGQNASTASRAMYQLSQAMGAGTMRKEDYKSIQNVSMDTMEFRQKALDAAVALGTLETKIDKVTGKTIYRSKINDKGAFDINEFAEHLTQDAWFTSDVMMKVFNDYSAAVDQIYEYAEEKGLTASKAIEELGDGVDQFGLKAFKAAQEARTWGDVIDSVKDAVSTGWMNTFENIFGDYEEAKELWTTAANELYDVFAEGGNERNDILKEWKETWYGRDSLMRGIADAWDGFKNILNAIKQAFREIFPPKTAQQLALFTMKFETLMLTFKEFTDRNYSKIVATFRGIFSVISIVVTVIKDLTSGVINIAKYLFGFSDSILDVTAGLGDFVTSLRKSLVESNAFGKVINVLSNGLIKIAELFRNFGGPVLDGIWEGVKKVGSVIVDAVHYVFSSFSNGMGEFDVNSFLDIIKNIFELGILSSIKKFITRFTDIISEGRNFLTPFQKTLKSLVGVFDSVRSSLITWQQSLKADILLKIAISIMLITAALAVLSGIDKEKLNQSMGIITIIFTELVASTRALRSGLSIKMIESIGVLIAIAVSTFILATAVKKLSVLDFDAMLNGLVGVGALIGMLTGMCIALAKTGGRITKGATGLVILSAAVVILAGVCEDLGALPFRQMEQGLFGVAVLLAALDLFLNTAKFGGMKAITTAAGIVIIAAAIGMLESSVTNFGIMDFNVLKQGLIAVGVLLTEIALFTELLSPTSKVISIGIAMVLLSESFEKIVPAFQEFEKISWDGVEKGIVAIAGVVLSLAFASKQSKLIGAVSLSVIFSGLKDITDAFKELGTLSWDDVIRNLVLVTGAIGIFIATAKALKDDAPDTFGMALVIIAIAGAMKMLSSIPWEAGLIGLGLLAGAFTILGVATKSLEPLVKSMFKLSLSISTLSLSLILFSGSMVALGIGIASFAGSLALAFLEFSAFKWETIGKGLLVLVGVLSSIAVIAAICKPLTGSILSLSFSLLSFSLSAAVMGYAIELIARGLTSLSGIGAESAAAISNLIREIGTAVLQLLPVLVTEVGNTIVALIQVISNSSVEFMEALKTIIFELLSVLRECIPEISATILEVINTLLDGFIEYGPTIIDKLITLIILLFDGLTNRMPELLSGAGKLIKVIADAIAVALENIDPDEFLKMITAVGLVSVVARLLVGLIGILPEAMAGALAAGALIAEIGVLIAALGAINQIPGLEWLISEGGNLLEVIGIAIGKFIGGIVGGLLDGATSNLPDVGTNLSIFMTNITPFIEGAKGIDSSMLDGVKALTDVILMLSVSELIDGITSFITGGSDISTFGEKLVPFGKAMVEFSNIVSGNIDENAVDAASRAGKMLSEMEANLPKEGGIFDYFTGTTISSSKFGEEINAFGESIVKFSDTVAGKVDTEAVEAASNAGLIMAKMEANLPKEGGIFDFFTGTASMKDFGAELEDFGNSVVKFSKSVEGGIDIEAIEAAGTAGSIMSALKDNLPNDGGVLAFFVGDNKLDDFGDELESFGTSVKAFSDAVQGGIDTTAVESAKNAGMMMAELEKTLPNQGGVLAFFEGDNNLGDFGENLQKFGGHLKAFDSLSSLMDPMKMGEVIDEVERIVNIAKGIDDIDVDDIEDFSDNLTSLAENGISNFIMAFDKSTEKVEKAAKSMIVTFSDSIKDSSQKLASSFKDIMSDSLDVIGSHSSSYQSSAATLMAYFRTGIFSSTETSKTVHTNLVETSITAITNQYDAYVEAGKYVAEGFVSGIQMQNELVAKSAEAMVKTAEKATRETAKIKSPSKLFSDLGKFIPQGFGNGIEEGSISVVEAIDDMIDSIYDETIDTMSNLNDLLNSDVEITPVIAPVYDMRDLDFTKAQLSSSLSADVTRPVMSLSNQILDAQTKIEESNNKVVESINELIQNVKDIGAQDKEINLYADTTKLASTLARPLDRQLNAIAQRRR